MAPRIGSRAIVIGASVAGLLAARVLAERYDRVGIDVHQVLAADRVTSDA